MASLHPPIDVIRQVYSFTPFDLSFINWIINGLDDSTLARQTILEYSDHYHLGYSPRDEFGKNLFEDWDQEEWNSFDCFMIECLQDYLREGIVVAPTENTAIKRLNAATSEEFIEFISEIHFGEKYDKHELHKQFTEEYPDFHNLTQRRFTSWVKIWAKFQGHKLEETKSGKDRAFILSHSSRPNENHDSGFAA